MLLEKKKELISEIIKKKKYTSKYLGNLNFDKKPRTDLIGKTYGKLKIIGSAGYIYQQCGRYSWYWICLCDCGEYTITSSQNLYKGDTKSCGCLVIDHASNLNLSHGRSNDLTYSSWAAMKQRCLNENHSGYHNYGGRGITICQEWQDSFEKFLNDMGERPSKNYWIERIDNDGNYEPDNCIWAEKSDQVRNKRTNRHVIYKGKK